MKYLLDREADVNAVNSDGYSALMLAVLNECKWTNSRSDGMKLINLLFVSAPLEVVKMLIAHGAEIDAMNTHRNTPLMIAAGNGIESH